MIGMKKQIWKAGLLCLMVTLMLLVGGCAPAGGRMESNGILWEYRTLSDGTLSVHPAYEKVGNSGRKYLSDVSGVIKVPAEINGVAVTELEDQAFLYCTEVKQVILSEGIV